MANSQVTVRDTQLEKQRLGFINLNLTELTTTTEPDIAAGSVVEVGGSLYSFTADETPSGWAGISNDTQVYIKLSPGTSDVTSSFTDTAPTYSDAKGGWYSGNDRYVARVYKNASGEAVQKETYSQESESGDALQLFLDSLPTFANRVVYDTPGNDTWVCPEDVRVVKVALIGGGGGGGGSMAKVDGGTAAAAGGGGQGGDVVIAVSSVTPGKEYSVTVGAGGSGNTGNSNASASRAGSGGDSTFDTLTASGGQGGQEAEHDNAGSNTYSIGGSAGTGSDPDIQNSAAGQNGESGGAGGSGRTSGAGGGVLFREWPLKYGDNGSGGASAGFAGSTSETTLNGKDGKKYGGGGSGGASSSQGSPPSVERITTGGDGADGIVIVSY